MMWVEDGQESQTLIQTRLMWHTYSKIMCYTFIKYKELNKNETTLPHATWILSQKALRLRPALSLPSTITISRVHYVIRPERWAHSVLDGGGPRSWKDSPKISELSRVRTPPHPDCLTLPRGLLSNWWAEICVLMHSQIQQTLISFPRPSNLML